jgi:hypothetical protein
VLASLAAAHPAQLPNLLVCRLEGDALAVNAIVDLDWTSYCLFLRRVRIPQPTINGMRFLKNNAVAEFRVQ